MKTAPAPDAMPAEPDLVRDLDQLSGSSCRDCARPLCGHEILFSIALGFKAAARCLPCLARGLEQHAEELRDQLWDYIQRRDCYRRAWETASGREGTTTDRPSCLWTDADPTPSRTRARSHESAMAPGAAADSWDAGDMACGELVMHLRGRMNALAPGGVLEVRALDPAAPEDLPAWCRLTGHHLLQANHPDYLIQCKKG